MTLAELGPAVRVQLELPNGLRVWFGQRELAVYAAIAKHLGGEAVEWRQRLT